MEPGVRISAAGEWRADVARDLRGMAVSASSRAGQHLRRHPEPDETTSNLAEGGFAPRVMEIVEVMKNPGCPRSRNQRPINSGGDITENSSPRGSSRELNKLDVQGTVVLEMLKLGAISELIPGELGQVDAGDCRDGRRRAARSDSSVGCPWTAWRRGSIRRRA